MRYYFDLSDGGWEPDQTGTELDDIPAAQREAVRFVGEVLKDEPYRLGRGEMRVNVRDDAGAVRFAIVVSFIS